MILLSWGGTKQVLTLKFQDWQLDQFKARTKKINIQKKIKVAYIDI